MVAFTRSWDDDGGTPRLWLSETWTLLPRVSYGETYYRHAEAVQETLELVQEPLGLYPGGLAFEESTERERGEWQS